MDLSTKYMGFDLPSPFMPGASPLADNLDTVKRLEDAGASAIVIRSLFQEELTQEEQHWQSNVRVHELSHPEARSYLPPTDMLKQGPEEYLEKVQRIRNAVKVPVIASLNGTTLGDWMEYAKRLHQAGAHGLELNVYRVVTDVKVSSDAVEQEMMNMLREVRRTVPIPVAVKLSPFFTALPHLANQLGRAGAQGLVLFNRFFQPDIDVENLEMVRKLHLSTSAELPLRLMWLGILHGRAGTDLCVSGGVHQPLDAVRAVMSGAAAIQVVSCLMRNGPDYLRVLREGLERWMGENGYESFKQLHGCMSLERCPDPAAFERANYIHMLNAPVVHE
ncbi:MAG: dihydroorotate dehydrogenase-like protein [Deltaproteobacteria bacterium]|nr:dihydroorotate dehydrogenase-like protein [Deltaproteobacteria bacterium]